MTNSGKKSRQIIKVAGSPREQGKQQGEQATALIADSVRRIQGGLTCFGLDKNQYQATLDKNIRFLEKTEPDIVEELYGLAEGSGLDFADIVLINLPLYFVYKWLPQECSQVLARGSATFDGKTYLLKNRDMGSEKVEHVILEREYPDGRKIIEVNGAGIITFPGNGLNNRGLALSTSGVWSKKMAINMELINNAHILLNSHLILEKCSKVDEAIEYLKTEKRMTGMNFIIADKEKAVAVEVTADGIFIEQDKRGILVRTNHYLAPEFSWLNRSPAEYPSTYKRFERAQVLLDEKHGHITFQEMLAIAGDHEDGPQNSLCRHGKRETDVETVYSGIIAVEDFQVWTALGNPCEALRLAHL